MKRKLVVVGLGLLIGGIIWGGRKREAVLGATEMVPECVLLRKGDLDCDGKITIADFAIWKVNYLWFRKQPTATPTRRPSVSIAPTPTPGCPPIPAGCQPKFVECFAEPCCPVAACPTTTLKPTITVKPTAIPTRSIIPGITGVVDECRKSSDCGTDMVCIKGECMPAGPTLPMSDF